MEVRTVQQPVIRYAGKRGRRDQEDDRIRSWVAECVGALMARLDAYNVDKDNGRRGEIDVHVHMNSLLEKKQKEELETRRKQYKEKPVQLCGSYCGNAGSMRCS